MTHIIAWWAITAWTIVASLTAWLVLSSLNLFLSLNLGQCRLLLLNRFLEHTISRGSFYWNLPWVLGHSWPPRPGDWAVLAAQRDRHSPNPRPPRHFLHPRQKIGCLHQSSTCSERRAFRPISCLNKKRAKLGEILVISGQKTVQSLCDIVKIKLSGDRFLWQ